MGHGMDAASYPVINFANNDALTTGMISKRDKSHDTETTTAQPMHVLIGLYARDTSTAEGATAEGETEPVKGLIASQPAKRSQPGKHRKWKWVKGVVGGALMAGAVGVAAWAGISHLKKHADTQMTTFYAPAGAPAMNLWGPNRAPVPEMQQVAPLAALHVPRPASFDSREAEDGSSGIVEVQSFYNGQSFTPPPGSVAGPNAAQDGDSARSLDTGSHASRPASDAGSGTAGSEYGTAVGVGSHNEGSEDAASMHSSNTDYYTPDSGSVAGSVAGSDAGW